LGFGISLGNCHSERPAIRHRAIEIIRFRAPTATHKAARPMTGARGLAERSLGSLDEQNTRRAAGADATGGSCAAF